MRLYAELGEEAVHNGDVDDWATDEQVEDFATYVEDVALTQGRFDPDGE